MPRSAAKATQRRQHEKASAPTTLAAQPTARLVAWMYAIVLLMAGAASYANSLNGSFLFDDFKVIVHNEAVRNFDPWLLVYGLGFRGFTMATFALDYRLYGLNAAGFHLTNLVIHLLAAAILFLLVKSVLELPRVRRTFQGDARATAFAIALLWVVHPLNTQAVTYIVQRHESLMGLCYLGFLYCLLQSVTSSAVWRWRLLAAVALLCGARSKEVMVTAPVVWLLLDRAVLADSWSMVFRERKWLFLAITVPLGAAVAVMLPRILGSADSIGASLPEFTPLEYLATQPGVLLRYLQLAVFPYPQCFDYGWPLAITSKEILVPGIFVLMLLAASVWVWLRNPTLGLLLLAFFIILAPSSSLVPIRDAAFEHRMYLPLIAIICALVLGSQWILSRLAPNGSGKLKVAFLGLIVVALGVATHARNKAYASPLRMWSDVVSKAPHNPRGYYWLGDALREQGDLSGASAAWQKAIDADRRVSQRYEEAAALADQRGNHQRAEVLSEMAARGTVTAEALVNLGKQCMQTAPEQARDHFLEALRREPHLSEAHNNLAMLVVKDDPALAERHYQLAIEQGPTNARAYNNYANLLARRGEFAKAIEYYETALRLEPQLPEALRNLPIVRRMQQQASAPQPQEQGASAP